MLCKFFGSVCLQLSRIHRSLCCINFTIGIRNILLRSSDSLRGNINRRLGICQTLVGRRFIGLGSVDSSIGNFLLALCTFQDTLCVVYIPLSDSNSLLRLINGTLFLL